MEDLKNGLFSLKKILIKLMQKKLINYIHQLKLFSPMKVRQYCPTGIYLRTFKSEGAAARAVHTYQGNISNAIKYNIKSKDYYWKKAESK